MEWGGRPEFVKLLEKRAKRGLQVKALENKPILYEDLYFVWTAFFELSRSRQYGFGGPQPLSVSEVLAWLDLNCIESPEDRREIFVLVQAMDEVWLKWAVEDAKRKSRKYPGKQDGRHNAPNGSRRSARKARG